MSNESDLLPDEEELAQLAQVLEERFIQRHDLYGEQTATGYVSVKRPLHKGHLIRHLRGTLTLGAYVLDPESRACFLVLDADDAPDWRRLQALARVLAEMDCPSYLEASRRGGHLWLFFEEPLPGRRVRLFGKGLLDYFGIQEMELFPKQDGLRSGPGSMIRLPFGVHRKSGRRYGFYMPDGEPLAPRLREQVRVLAQPGTVPGDVLERFAAVGEEVRARQPQRRPWPRRARGENGETPVWDRIKGAITVRQFVLRYVELSPSGMGLCPFHDDTVPSFSVYDKTNSWKCFACDIGGSVIDFHMHLRGCDFKTAVDELAEMLLEPSGIEVEDVD